MCLLSIFLAWSLRSVMLVHYLMPEVFRSFRNILFICIPHCDTPISYLLTWCCISCPRKSYPPTPLSRKTLACTHESLIVERPITCPSLCSRDVLLAIDVDQDCHDTRPSTWVSNMQPSWLPLLSFSVSAGHNLGCMTSGT